MIDAVKDRGVRSSGRLWALSLGLLLVSLQALAQPQPSPEPTPTMDERMQAYRVTTLDVLWVDARVRGAQPALAKVWAQIFADRKLPYRTRLW